MPVMSNCYVIENNYEGNRQQQQQQQQQHSVKYMHVFCEVCVLFNELIIKVSLAPAAFIIMTPSLSHFCLSFLYLIIKKKDAK